MLWTLVGIVLLIVFVPVAVGIVWSLISAVWDAISDALLVAVGLALFVGACALLGASFGAPGAITAASGLWLWVCWKALEAHRDVRRARQTPQSPPDRVA